MDKLIIANWKMQLSLSASQKLAKELAATLPKTRTSVVICPDYAALPGVAAILKKSRLALGAQDSAVAVAGAYTGEVSPASLKALGVKYVILGHSERREHLHENSAIINAKLRAALAQGLTPILCVGEKLAERESGATRMYLREELRHALKGVKIKTAADLVLAYEPIWAISTNSNAKPMAPEEADAVQSFLREQAAVSLHKRLRVIYGGSVTTDNAAAFLKQKNIDGLLVGGAALKVKDFRAICLA